MPVVVHQEMGEREGDAQEMLDSPADQHHYNHHGRHNHHYHHYKFPHLAPRFLLLIKPSLLDWMRRVPGLVIDPISEHFDDESESDSCHI